MTQSDRQDTPKAHKEERATKKIGKSKFIPCELDCFSSICTPEWVQKAMTPETKQKF